MQTNNTTSNNNVTIDVQATEVHVITLDLEMCDARNAVAEGHAGVGSVERNYAIRMNNFFVSSDYAWFTYSSGEMKKSPEGKELFKEKKAFYASLTAKGHKNPATVWARITQQYALEDAEKRSLFGFQPVQKAPEGQLDEEGNEVESEEKVQQRTTKSPDVRNMEDLISLYKFNRRQESLSDKLNVVQTHLVAALAAMGIDVSTVE